MDNETGEVIMQETVLCNTSLDLETGEPVEIDSEITNQRATLSSSRKKFSVPKSYLIQPEPKEDKNDKCCLSSQETFSLSSKKQVIDLKEDIILGYNKTSHRLFLIPTLFLFPKLAAVYIFVIEIGLHIWSHKRNKRNKNPRIYYRSPLHNLSRHFCSICRETRELHSYHRKHLVATSFQ